MQIVRTSERCVHICVQKARQTQSESSKKPDFIEVCDTYVTLKLDFVLFVFIKNFVSLSTRLNFVF